MKILLVAFALIVVGVGIGALIGRRKRNSAISTGVQGNSSVPMETQAATMPSSCALGADCALPCDYELPDDEPVYFDDEHLDRYAHTDAADYAAEAVGEFEEVMRTMRPDEVHTWLLSLERRGVQLPVALRDEAFMLMEG